MTPLTDADLAEQVRRLEAEVCRLRADDWQVSRVLAWIKNPDRQFSGTAFTAGAEREVAFWFEMVLMDRDKALAELARWRAASALPLESLEAVASTVRPDAGRM